MFLIISGLDFFVGSFDYYYVLLNNYQDIIVYDYCV